MSGPIQTVARKGMSGRLENKARLSRLLVSATKTCCRICRPVTPAELKSWAEA